MADLSLASTATASGDQPAKVVVQLNERHRERQLRIDAAHAEQASTHEQSENLDYFLDSFGQQASDIERNIDNLSTENAEAADRSALAARCDRIAKSLQQLQLYLSSSVLFLPDSVVKRNQRTLAELNTQLAAVKTELLPKKKFGFRAKSAAPVLPAKQAPVAAMPVVQVDWTCRDRSDEEIELDEERVNGKDITVQALRRCVLRIRGHPGSLQLSGLDDCLVLCGPVARSVFADNCRGTILAFGCQQFRLHSSSACDVYMHVTSRAIVEDCRAIRVGPYTFSYAGIELDFAKAALDAERNNWRDVADFNWLSGEQQSPHWRALDELAWVRDWPKRTEQFRVQTMQKALD